MKICCFYCNAAVDCNLYHDVFVLDGGKVLPLVELAAREVACHIPFEIVENNTPPVPEELQLRIAYWSFPENEEDIRLYSCLANGSADEFQRGENLLKAKAVKDLLQIGALAIFLLALSCAMCLLLSLLPSISPLSLHFFARLLFLSLPSFQVWQVLCYPLLSGAALFALKNRTQWRSQQTEREREVEGKPVYV